MYNQKVTTTQILTENAEMFQKFKISSLNLKKN
jgi:hypothetical protein